jgi:hypothetical protein
VVKNLLPNDYPLVVVTPGQPKLETHVQVTAGPTNHFVCPAMAVPQPAAPSGPSYLVMGGSLIPGERLGDVVLGEDIHMAEAEYRLQLGMPCHYNKDGLDVLALGGHVAQVTASRATLAGVKLGVSDAATADDLLHAFPTLQWRQLGANKVLEADDEGVAFDLGRDGRGIQGVTVYRAHSPMLHMGVEGQ